MSVVEAYGYVVETAEVFALKTVAVIDTPPEP